MPFLGHFKGNILVADDDIVHRDLIATRLRALGYEVTEAENGDDALKAFAVSNPPRLAIVDWNMPGLSGPELCQEIRALSDKSTRYIYLILLTVRNDMADLEIGLKAGADDYLTKPVHPVELEARIDNARRFLNSNDMAVRTVDELTAANEVLAAFSRALAHDLRGTLTTIGGYAYLLHQAPTLDEENRELTSSITRAVDLMKAMVEDVLILETAAKGPERSPFNPRKAIEDAAAGIANIVMVTGPLPEEITAHRTSVVRSLRNLFENASRYARSPHKTEVTVNITISEENDGWVFIIDDDGPGIPPTEREEIFQSFQRGTTSHETEGTGLGLAIVAACARAHDGRVWVSNGPENGARFYFKLGRPQP